MNSDSQKIQVQTPSTDSIFIDKTGGQDFDEWGPMTPETPPSSWEPTDEEQDAQQQPPILPVEEQWAQLPDDDEQKLNHWSVS